MTEKNAASWRSLRSESPLHPQPAGPTRLRPILMTSAAIVLGEVPTALSQAEGSEFNRPMAVAVIGGVITSTLLTLVVVPVAYTWIDKLHFLSKKNQRRSE